MENIYLLETEDSFIRETSLKEFLESIKDYEIVKYDATITPITRVVEDLDTYNFLCNHKCIILENAYFLTSSSIKNDLNQDLSKFEKYLKSPNPDNILVILCNKLDNKKNIVKLVSKVSERLNTGFSIKQIIKKGCSEYNIDNITINYLVDYCLNNNEKIINELEKLKLYKYDDKTITKKDIDAIVTKSIDDNIFTLVDAIVTKKKKVAIEIYNDMILHGEDPMHILILVANQFSLFYSVRVLKNEGLKKDEIASSLGVHPYPVQLALEKSFKYDSKELLTNISKLADMDYNYKIGKIDLNNSFVLFFIDL